MKMNGNVVIGAGPIREKQSKLIIVDDKIYEKNKYERTYIGYIEVYAGKCI